jgi:hypothetical protein
MALRNTGAGDEAYQLWCEWSSKSPKYDEQVQRQQWQSLRQWRHDGREVGIRTLFWLAEQEGWTASVDEAVAAEAGAKAAAEVVTSLAASTSALVKPSRTSRNEPHAASAAA